MSLDLRKLKHVVTRDDGVAVAQCPACAEIGHDLHGKNHLIVYPNGAYGCIAHSGAAQGTTAHKSHCRRIFQLAGDGGGTPEKRSETRKPRYGCAMPGGSSLRSGKTVRRW